MENPNRKSRSGFLYRQSSDLFRAQEPALGQFAHTVELIENGASMRVSVEAAVNEVGGDCLSALG